MVITVFENIDVNIPDEDAEIIESYGNGIVPSAYELLLKQEGITNTSKTSLIESEIQRFVKEEADFVKNFKELWDRDEI